MSVTIHDAETVIGKRVRVLDPSCYLHEEVVTVLGFRGPGRDVLRTSGGPLDWTRPRLRLEHVPEPKAESET